MDKRRSITVGTVVASIGVMALAFAPVLDRVAVIWWGSGLIGLVVAFSLNAVPQRRRIRTRVFSGVAFVAAAAAGITLVGLVSPASAAPVGTPGQPVRSGAAQVVALASGLRQVGSGEASRAIDEAERHHYEPKSGLRPDWDAATACVHEGAKVVSVPLLGTDVPEMTKLSFITVNGVCAPCLAAAAGFTTGTIAKCVSNAWS